MPNISRILFPVDFSDRCRGAAHYAVAMAGRFNSELILLHVVETPLARPGELDFGALAFESDLESRVEHYRQLLDSFLGADASHINVQRRIERGDPARTIIRIARDEQAGLIMMPTHGYGAFRRFILGSVTAKVLHDADIPVWTGVHLESAPALEQICCRSIMCAVDDSEAALRPLEMAAEFAEEYGAKLTVTHAVPGSEAMPDRYMDNELRMVQIKEARERLESRLEQLGVRPGLCIEGGDVAKIVRYAATEHKADLLFIGRSAHPGLAGRLRTHSYAIIRESPCPVISV